MSVGRISIQLSTSRLNGVLLAIRNAVNPFGDATSFLASRGIGDGDMADVQGAAGSIGTPAVPVIFMTGARLATVAAIRAIQPARSAAPAAKRKLKPAAKRKPSAAKSKARAAGRKRP
jgi:hypothetical protein